MATPQKPARKLFINLALGSIHVSDAPYVLRGLNMGRKTLLCQLVASKAQEDYRALESTECLIDGLVWDVEEKLLERRKMPSRADIANTFSSDVLERLIDERNDNDSKIEHAESTDDCAELLAADEVIQNRLNVVVMAAINELQQYEW